MRYLPALLISTCNTLRLIAVTELCGRGRLGGMNRVLLGVAIARHLRKSNQGSVPIECRITTLRHMRPRQIRFDGMTTSKKAYKTLSKSK